MLLVSNFQVSNSKLGTGSLKRDTSLRMSSGAKASFNASYCEGKKEKPQKYQAFLAIPKRNNIMGKNMVLIITFEKPYSTKIRIPNFSFRVN